MSQDINISADKAVDILLRGLSLSGTVICEDERNKYEQYKSLLNKQFVFLEPESTDDQTRTDIWYMPEEYQSLDIKQHVLGLCRTKEEEQRAEEEFALYEERDLLNLLRLLAYIVSHMRENNILWGVGRGSSVSSYVLYLLGVHKVNSLKYDLDIKEFLK